MEKLVEGNEKLKTKSEKGNVKELSNCFRQPITNSVRISGEVSLITIGWFQYNYKFIKSRTKTLLK